MTNIVGSGMGFLCFCDIRLEEKPPGCVDLLYPGLVDRDRLVMNNPSPFFELLNKCRFVFPDIIEEDMKGVGVGKLRVNPVGCIPGAFSASPLVHQSEGFSYLTAVHELAAFINDTNDSAHFPSQSGYPILVNASLN